MSSPLIPGVVKEPSMTVRSNGTRTEDDTATFVASAVQETAKTLVAAGAEELKKRLLLRSEWTGIGMRWIRSLLGRREWRLPCLDVHVRL